MTRVDIFDEEATFRDLALGSEQAFEVIYNYYSPRLFNFVDRMLYFSDISEEIVQDIFIRLWEKRSYFSHVHNPVSYLYQMASNRVLDYQKKIAARRPILDFIIYQQVSNVTDTDERLLYNETLSLVNEALASLPSQRRKIYELSRNEGLSHDQIAEKLNIAKSTVANQLVSALKQIRHYLEKHMDFFSFAIFYLLTQS